MKNFTYSILRVALLGGTSTRLRLRVPWLASGSHGLITSPAGKAGRACKMSPLPPEVMQVARLLAAHVRSHGWCWWGGKADLGVGEQGYPGLRREIRELGDMGVFVHRLKV